MMPSIFLDNSETPNILIAAVFFEYDLMVTYCRSLYLFDNQ